MKRFLPYILIFVILAGLFSPLANVRAEDPKGTCLIGSYGVTADITETECRKKAGNQGFRWDPYDTTQQAVVDENQQSINQENTSTSTADNAFQAEIDKGCDKILSASFSGCVLKLFYYTAFQVPALLLALSAKFFNALVSLALDSALTISSSFVSEAWVIVRDLSNIFFILILLYIAFQTILGLSGHGGGPRKMIAQVIIMALLINFSMFFTKIIIDSSNILALVFYNRVNVETKEASGQIRPYEQSTPNGNEKDLSGGMVKAFDPTQLLSEEFFTKAKQTKVLGRLVTSEQMPFALTLGVMIISGAIMLYAAYTFMIAGLAFLGRLIELWVLIIFSPFAFMSSVVPRLSHIEGIGWSSWLKKLISTSFMAPIFMFFIYLIFKLVHADIFSSFTSGEGFITFMLSILIPALIILALLKKATEFAKKGGGEFGQAVMSGAKMIGGLTVGGAALGGAALARGTIGATAKYVQNDATRQKDFKTFGGYKDWSTAKKLNPFAYVGQVKKTATAAIATGIHTIPGTGGKTIGEHLQAQDKGFGEKVHATHVLDQKMQQEFPTYGKDAKYKDLTEREQAVVKKEIDKDEIAKFQYGKLFKDLGTREAGDIMHEYDTGRRILEDEHTGVKTDANVTIDPTTGALLSAINRTTGTPMAIANQKIRSDVVAGHSKTEAAIGEFVQALRKGSYDIRNLPDMSAKTKGFPKFGVGSIALIAAGVRMGIKKGVGVEHYGTPQRDIFKDIGNTITESLKNAKINVNIGGHGNDNHAKEVKSVGH